MPTEGQTDIVGLDEFRRELRKARQDSNRVMGRLNGTAAQLVTDAAESKGRRLGGVHAHVIRQRSMRASQSSRAARVIVGGAARKHGPALGAEFGSKQFAQFPRWRGNQWNPDAANGVGYMLHPAIRATRDEVLDVYDRGITELLSDAFPD